MDDAVRERHGVSCRTNSEDKALSHITVWERDGVVVVKHDYVSGAILTRWQARYLAAKLYRLSRRIRDREDSAPSDEG